MIELRIVPNRNRKDAVTINSCDNPIEVAAELQSCKVQIPKKCKEFTYLYTDGYGFEYYIKCSNK